MARPHSPMDASPSPQPQQPLTKRDIRRNRIMERLQTMMDSFSSNHQAHYRAQLQAVQVDMTLVLRADPYNNEGPLEDGGEEVRQLAESMMGGVGGVMGGVLGGEGDEAAKRDYLAMAGRRYAGFVGGVNDALEGRDGGLTALHDNYHSSIASLERLTQQKLHQAEEEHKALTATIRQRLIASITKKRQHLLRDKEQLDIADSNALLLHPSHFSINNPGSPGGNGNRKTRHLRHRATSPGAAAELAENGLKRKRKLGATDDDGNESPAPAFRALPPPDALGGGRSPFKDAREKNVYTQYEAPAYSLERIFTDKELAMATATAQQATYRYFHQPQQQQPQQQEVATNGHGTNAANSIDGEALAAAAEVADGEEGAAHPTTEGAAGTPPPSHIPPTPAAVEMERTTSSSHQVLTRGGARANPLAALSDLATAAAGVALAPQVVRDNPFAPVVPSYHAVTRSEKSGAPAPLGVGVLDIENDFEMIRRAGSPGVNTDNGGGNNSHDNGLGLDTDEVMQDDPSGTGAAVQGKEMRRQLLNQALGLPSVTQPYRLPLGETGPAVIAKGIDRPVWTGFAPQATYEQQRLRMQVANAGGNPVAGVKFPVSGLVGEAFGGGAGGAGGAFGGGFGAAQAGGSMAAALQGRIGGGVGGEAMSRTSSAGGVSEAGGEVGGVGAGAGASVGSASARRGRGRLV